MTGYLELQSWFAAGLISDAGPQAFLDQLATSGPVSPDEALSIYRSSSRAACINALKQVYPVCHALLGERSFRTLSRDYLTLRPSSGADLNQYGEAFADILMEFVVRLDEQTARSLPGGLAYLADLARLEWAWHRSYFANAVPGGAWSGFDAPEFVTLSEQSPDILLFVLDPTLTMLASDWPIQAIWEAHHQADPEPDLSGVDVSTVLQQRECLLVRRVGFIPEEVAISEAFFELLTRVYSNDPNRASLAALVTADLDPLLATAVQEGWIVGFRLHGGEGQ